MLSRLRQSTNRDDKGFTLIELLVVMIIIGILAAIAIPVFLNQRNRAYESAIKSDLRTVSNEVETFFVDNQAYPTDAEGATLITDLGDTLTSDVVVAYNAGTGTYCLEGSHDLVDDVTYAYNSNTGGLGERNTTCA